MKLIDLEALKYYDKHIKEYIKRHDELLLNGKTNCPNCGAVITGEKCEYCGTNFTIFTLDN